MTLVEQHRGEDLIVVPALYIPHRLDRFVGPHSVTDWHLIYGAGLEWKPTDNRSLMFARYHGLKAIRTDREVDWKNGMNNETDILLAGHAADFHGVLLY